jgi:hypothetical protein
MLCRFGQGVGLGGERWSRVVSYRERPPNKRLVRYVRTRVQPMVCYFLRNFDFNGYDESLKIFRISAVEDSL